MAEGLTTSTARIGQPLDTNTVTDLAVRLGARAQLNDRADALVAPDLVGGRGRGEHAPAGEVHTLAGTDDEERGGAPVPVGHDAHVGVAHAGMSPAHFVSVPPRPGVRVSRSAAGTDR